jgi:multiple sugar transport system substrate-binding protein
VTVDSPQARQGLDFLVDGLRDGWIPQTAMTYEEESSWGDFESGKLLFLNNWPFIYSRVSPDPPRHPGRARGADLAGTGGRAEESCRSGDSYWF